MSLTSSCSALLLLLLLLIMVMCTATWMLVYCLVACIMTWRDHGEAKHYRQQQTDKAPHGNNNTISRWMWTAAIANSPHSASDTLSSFPAFEAPLDAKRPPQLLTPELTGSGMSPSPRKQAKWGTGAGHVDQEQHVKDEMVRGQGLRVLYCLALVEGGGARAGEASGAIFCTVS
jgi:hypothetical protein